MTLPAPGGPGRRGLWVLGLALLLAGVGAWLLSPWWSGRRAGPGLQSGRVTRGELVARVSATGSLEALTTVTVGSQVSGLVDRVLVDVNSPVRRGQALVTLDPATLQARVAQARASLDGSLAAGENARAGLLNARAEVAQSRAGVASAEANLGQAVAQVASAEAAVKNARAGGDRARAELRNAAAEAARFEELKERDLIPASELDTRRTALRVAEAAVAVAAADLEQAAASRVQAVARVEAARGDLEAARTRWQAARARETSASAQIRSAEAQVRQARASLEQALVDLDRTTLRAPIDGVVISRRVEVGQTVAAQFQAPELLRIAGDLHQMQVKAEINEADIGRVSLGDPVEFRVDAWPERRFQGRIAQVQPAPVEGGDAKVVVYGVLVEAPNPELLLKPGMTATVEISVERRAGALTVPNQALRFVPPDLPQDTAGEETSGEGGRGAPARSGPGRPGTVWVPGPEAPRRVELRLGITDGERTEVLQGDLREGDEVYTEVAEEGGRASGNGARASRSRMRMRF